MAAKKASLKDVAQKCGVSISTVSRVLNNKQDNRFSASEKIKEKIYAAANELNYRPNTMAKSLKMQRTNQIMIYSLSVHDFMRFSIFMPILNHSLQELNQNNYNVLAGLRTNKEHHIPIDSSMLDGALIFDLHRQNPYEIEEMEKLGIPYIVVNDKAGPNGGAVLLDDKGGCRMAVNHLIDLGHQEILYTTSKVVEKQPSRKGAHYSVIDREDAFYTTLKERGLISVSKKGNYISPENALQKYVMQGRITAAVCYDNQDALELMRLAIAEGIKIPEQLSIICFNELPERYDSLPALTSIGIPAEQVGKCAANMLVDMIGGKKGYTQIFQESLIIRDTTSSPRITVSDIIS